jgi:hypothetical protein
MHLEKPFGKNATMNWLMKTKLILIYNAHIKMYDVKNNTFGEATSTPNEQGVTMKANIICGHSTTGNKYQHKTHAKPGVVIILQYKRLAIPASLLYLQPVYFYYYYLTYEKKLPRFKLTLLFSAVSTFAQQVTKVTDPVEWINPLMGTQSKYDLSNGNTYPAIALPWGMNFWTPQTGKMGDGWQYTYDAYKINGFKQTHQPSPWMNDYGQFAIMPVTANLKYRKMAAKAGFRTRPK